MHSDNIPLSPTIHLGYLTDDVLISQVSRATESIRFVGPGMSVQVAKAFAARWKYSPPASIEIILDADADLCRLGFGDGDALSILLLAAEENGGQIHRQSGIRLCVLDIDGERIIFPPAPRLLEDPGRESSEIILGPPQHEPFHDSILTHSELKPITMTADAVEKVRQELKDNPPQPFDLARQVRVLSTRFQFVEFSLESAALSRKRVPVPADLLGITNGSETEELLRANFQLIAKGDEVSGENLMKRRDAIEKKYLITISHYGKVIRRNNRAAFDKEVEELKAAIATFQKEAGKKIDAAIEKNAPQSFSSSCRL